VLVKKYALRHLGHSGGWGRRRQQQQQQQQQQQEKPHNYRSMLASQPHASHCKLPSHQATPGSVATNTRRCQVLTPPQLTALQWQTDQCWASARAQRLRRVEVCMCGSTSTTTRRHVRNQSGGDRGKAAQNRKVR
jgi:hypothetical protein